VGEASLQLFHYRFLSHLFQFIIHYNRTDEFGEINWFTDAMGKTLCCKFIFVSDFIIFFVK
jgi:hypothetical protein